MVADLRRAVSRKRVSTMPARELGARPLTPAGWELIVEVNRYLRAVDVFRAAGIEPTWREDV